MRLATRGRVAQVFATVDPGATASVPGLLGTPEVLDTHLLPYHQIFYSASDHRRTLSTSHDQIQRVGTGHHNVAFGRRAR